MLFMALIHSHCDWCFNSSVTPSAVAICLMMSRQRSCACSSRSATENPTQINIEKLNTQKSITDGSITDSLPFRGTAAKPPEPKRRETMSLTEMESYRELILENIEYDCLKQRFGTYREDLDEIVELLVETVCAKRKTTRIAGADFPHEVVRSRFLKLDSSHIEFVMDCLQKNTTEVRC